MWELVFWIALGLWLYAQVGYAAVLACLVWHPRTARREDDRPRVSLIIPAYNEQAVLQRKLENTLAIDYPRERLEILVASDGSDDGTPQIARRFAARGVTLLEFSERRGKASALNDAIAAARGEVLALCDANVMFQPDALRLLVGELLDPRVGAASGNVRIASQDSNFAEGESFYYRLERGLQERESQLGSLMGVDGGMYVVRRELVRPLPRDTILDDFVISMQVLRRGKRVVYQAAALADENATPTARQEFRRRVRVAAGSVQSVCRGDFPPPWQVIHFWQYVSHKLLRWLGPLWLLLMFCLSLWLCGQSRGYGLLLGAQGLGYLLALVAALRTDVRATRLGGVAFYVVLSHLAQGWGLVKGLLNLQPVTWAKAQRLTAADAAGPD